MVKSFEDQGIRTVFEGIEESWQLELAEKSGASMVQGFVLARPELAPTSFRAFDKNRRARVAVVDAAAPAPAPGPHPGRPTKAFGRKGST
jgi:EAL domain-containing protein (putative c-di-GMP-specific phosphodiesterase class I)